ncbi:MULTISPECIES: neuraminidase-like domain-containing protein [unclassified Pseudomonas]|uniref:Tc toxin subunit A-related protein n=1 Tax=unclassified Pseudomonas TaxID=196821 RepID=UPI0025F02DF7|nr:MULTISPECIES: neuraminidase-like domain-containing protein [unclassified Pseudomonas]
MPSTTNTPAAATYATLFPEQLADRCAPDALEANSGPVAYLHALYQQALALEATRPGRRAPKESSERFTLAQRRPDIGELLLNQEGLEKQIPALTLAISALTRQAQAHAGQNTPLAEAVSKAQQRVGLPFHYPLAQIQAVLRHKELSLFDLLQQSEYSFPDFCHGNLRTDELRQIMRTATGFSPALQKLLQDDDLNDREDFLATRFSTTGSNASAASKLNSVEFFCQKTGVKPEDVLDLLAIAGVDDGASKGVTSVKTSTAYQVAGSKTADGKHYGAVFINNGESKSLSLRDTLSGPGIQLEITDATAAHYARIHKLIHLAHALELSFAETDLLLMSALRAEGQTKDFHITANTLRAIGVFRFFNEAYDVKVEQFAALIHEVSPYAVGDKVPLLDRVLDGPGSGQLAEIDDRLSIDDGTFDPAEKVDGDGKSAASSTMGRLCRALGLSEQVANDYLKQVTKALGQTKPKRSLALLSSLYRLSRLPRLLRLSANEGANLIALLTLGNDQVQGIVAGKGQISDDPDKADILDVLMALANAERWLRRNELTPSVVLALLSAPKASDQVLNQIEAAREKVLGEAPPDVAGTCLSELNIRSVPKANEAFEAKNSTWLTVLEDYLDKNGLIKPRLPAEPTLRNELVDLLRGKLKKNAGDAADLAQALATELTNARIKQEDLAKDVFKRMFANSLEPSLASSYALALLRWIKRSPLDLLSDLLVPVPANQAQRTRSFALWSDMARYTLAISLTGLSPAGLEALIEHPQWFAFKNDNTQSPISNELNLALLYQITRYRAWIGICRENGFDEGNALGYLSSLRASNEPAAVEAAASQLGKFIGWDMQETLLALPHDMVSTSTTRKPEKNTVKTKEPAKKSGTLDEFITWLTADEIKAYSDQKSKIFMPSALLSSFFDHGHHSYSPIVDGTNRKFKKFLSENPGPLLLTPEQYNEADYDPKYWAKLFEEIKASGKTPVLPKPLEMRMIGAPVEEPPDTSTPTTDAPTVFAKEGDARVPTTMRDIDVVLRLRSLSATTGLSCQSLLGVSWLDEASSYAAFHTAGLLLLGACTDEAREAIEPGLQVKWRDALVDYLLSEWVPKDAGRQAALISVDDLSSYFLTDVSVTSQARDTTAITQAVASLQHYLHRLFSHLEPGYSASLFPGGADSAWQRYLSHYGTWKEWQAQFNHPENLIYYANRPNKTAAFQELEVEVNQGKLDTELLHTAVCNYLTKFEKLSNLQIVSGYLDGHDPKNDTYHLIGKTNTSPAEYYWRSVDMGLRDDRQRLSPLAWSEWEKITLPVSGQIAQSSYDEPVVTTVTNADGKQESKTITIPHTSDAIRPVIIAGRPYVFWVERGVTGLPSADEKNQTPTKFRKLSVQYAYRQSDGFWSTANELLCLDGTENGERLADKDANNKPNAYLKDDTYIPGLIVFVDMEGARATDPWLTVILYNCKREGKGLGTLNDDYFFEARDLLLIEKKPIPKDIKNKKNSKDSFVMTVFKSYKDIRKVQHTFDGQVVFIKQISNTVYTARSKSPIDENFSLELFTLTIEITDSQLKKAIIKANLPPLHNNAALMVKRPDNDRLEALKVSLIIREDHVIAVHTYDFTFDKQGDYTFFLKDRSNDRDFEKKIIFNFLTSDTDEFWDVMIVKNTEQAQFLDLRSANKTLPKLPSNSVRLNTLFGKQLVARASEGVERALGWDTQTLKEPTIDEAEPNPRVDFHGANGLYFRELFLHLPALIASRLTEQQQFEEAESWYLHYLFDPYRALPGEDGRPAYWNTRPLAEVGSLTSELRKSVDPIARAFILSRYYRQAVFLDLVENWQRQGDHYYRQLTLSSLNHAWLCYQQALKLIGPLPERAAVSRWSPVPLAKASENSFRMPVNQRVIEARKLLERRLYNLRHGLTLDGKALPNLGWGDEGGDPFASAKGGLSIITGTYNSNRAPVPAYRFRQLLPAARAAAQQLLDMGRHYMKLMEDEFNTSLSVLFKAQEIRMSDFTLQLGKENINSIKAKKRELELSLEAAEFRKNHWAGLLEIGRSPREEAATAMTWTAGVLKYAAIPAEIVAGGIDGVVPTILGMAVGGTRPAELTRMGSKAMSMSSTALSFLANQLQTESGYERRATGWTFDMRQAEWDMRLIDQQITETNIELNASTISLQQARQERKNLEEAYVAMTTGFTIIPIYNWLVARQELLYGAAYDAVLSLCLSVEAAWRYEIGDYKREAFIKTSAWSDSYKGMLAGESLLVDLQEMENACLLANERRLTIKKTFSLRKLLGEKNWTDNVKTLAQGDSLAFGFAASEFDKNYPGHYLRQLKHVSVSLVMESGQQLEELSAILTQAANMTLVEPDLQGADYLYSEGKTPPPESIKRNLRAQQQIALSSQVQEDGLGYGPGDWVYELMFHDGRYLPFEGTGAISQWQLEIPDSDMAKLLITGANPVVKDIQINLVYSSLAGTSDFVKHIKDLHKRPAKPDAPAKTS